MNYCQTGKSCSKYFSFLKYFMSYSINVMNSILYIFMGIFISFLKPLHVRFSFIYSRRHLLSGIDLMGILYTHYKES